MSISHESTLLPCEESDRAGLWLECDVGKTGLEAAPLSQNLIILSGSWQTMQMHLQVPP